METSSKSILIDKNYFTHLSKIFKEGRRKKKRKRK